MYRMRWGCGMLVGAVLLAGCNGASTTPSTLKGDVSRSAVSGPRSAGASSRAVSSVMPGAETVRGVYVIATGDVSRSRLRDTVQDADKAAKWVTQTWGDVWRGRAPATIYVPRTAQEFHALGGGASKGDQVSATTTVAGVVVLNPGVSSKVTAEGQVVVLAHELTHVALHQAGLTHTPRWVIEGSAELTAYIPTGFSLARAAPQVATKVRAGRPPTGPPADEAFSGENGSLQSTYQQAYAWCLFLSRKFGLPAFKRFVKQADRESAETAFRDQFHTTTAELSNAYRTWLRARIS